MGFFYIYINIDIQYNTINLKKTQSPGTKNLSYLGIQKTKKNKTTKKQKKKQK